MSFFRPLWLFCLVWSMSSCKPQIGKPSAVFVEVSLPQILKSRSGQAEMVDRGVMQISEYGIPKQKLIFSLDIIASGDHAGTLPNCRRPLPDHFEIGELLCENHPEQRQKILMKHVFQQCYTHKEVSKKTPTAPLKLLGCQSARVMIYQFKPELQVDIVY